MGSMPSRLEQQEVSPLVGKPSPQPDSPGRRRFLQKAGALGLTALLSAVTRPGVAKGQEAPGVSGSEAAAAANPGVAELPGAPIESPLTADPATGVIDGSSSPEAISAPPKLKIGFLESYTGKSEDKEREATEILSSLFYTASQLPPLAGDVETFVGNSNLPKHFSGSKDGWNTFIMVCAVNTEDIGLPPDYASPFRFVVGATPDQELNGKRYGKSIVNRIYVLVDRFKDPVYTQSSMEALFALDYTMQSYRDTGEWFSQNSGRDVVSLNEELRSAEFKRNMTTSGFFAGLKTYAALTSQENKAVLDSLGVAPSPRLARLNYLMQAFPTEEAKKQFIHDKLIKG